MKMKIPKKHSTIADLCNELISLQKPIEGEATLEEGEYRKISHEKLKREVAAGRQLRQELIEVGVGYDTQKRVFTAGGHTITHDLANYFGYFVDQLNIINPLRELKYDDKNKRFITLEGEVVSALPIGEPQAVHRARPIPKETTLKNILTAKINIFAPLEADAYCVGGLRWIGWTEGSALPVQYYRLKQ